MMSVVVLKVKFFNCGVVLFSLDSQSTSSSIHPFNIYEKAAEASWNSDLALLLVQIYDLDIY